MNSLNDKRVLVTGAGGFIGSHLVEALLPLTGEVTALLHYDSRPHWGNLEFLPPNALESLRVISGDVCDPFFTRKATQGMDCVFHLAALISIPYSYQAPTAFFQTNLMGTLSVLEACREAKVMRLVCTSTSECYGTARAERIDENHPLQAQSPYAASKIAADKAIESYVCSFETPAVIMRPFNAYGPRQSARAIIPTIITQALSDAPTIRLGALDPTRDLTYVEDVAQGFIAAASTPGGEGEVFNLGVGQTISIGELAKLILEIAGVEKPIETDRDRIRPQASEVMRLISDNSKARERLGWSPRVSLREGLGRAIEFVRGRLGFYKSGRYTV